MAGLRWMGQAGTLACALVGLVVLAAPAPLAMPKYRNQAVREALVEKQRENLSDGDIRYRQDFRGVYAAALTRWLNLDARGILGGDFGGPAWLG